MESLLLSLMIGFCVGCIVGALGAGGGILSVPTLVYLLGQNPHAAGVGSLIIVGATAMISLIPRARERRVRWKDGLIFGLCSTVATFLGSRLSFWVSAQVLMLLFGALLVVAGTVMLWKAWGDFKSPCGRSGGADTAVEPVAGSVRGERAFRRHDWIRLAVAASFTGLLTGFFGVGGGFIVVPMLVLALNFNIREASATSLLVMLFASVVGLLSRIGAPLNVEWLVVIPFALASMLGGLVGAPASRKVVDSVLTSSFGVLLFLVAIGVFVAELR